MALTDYILQKANAKNYTIKAVILLCRLLEARITSMTISRKLSEHPNFPSIFSISTTLNSFNLKNVVLRTSLEQLSVYSCISFVQLKMNGTHYFSVIRYIDNKRVTFFSPISNKWETMAFGEFETIFSGIALLAEVDVQSGQKDFYKQLKKEHIQKLILYALILFLPTLFFIGIAISTHQSQSGYEVIPLTIYGLLSMIATGICLVIFINRNTTLSPLMELFCPKNSHIDCNHVINQGGSGFLGLSWTTIGLSYFIGNFLSVMLSGFERNGIMLIVSWLSIAAAPYILYSVYYQWRILKKWCIMCLMIQAILFLQFIICLSWDFILPKSISITDVITISICFFLPLIIISFLEKLINNLTKQEKEIHQLKRVKYNSVLFQSVLKQQKPLSVSTEQLGIFLGNPDAPHKLVKVSSPYCNPCSIAHEKIEELLRTYKNNLQVQIIFATSVEEEDIRTLPVTHLLAIDQNGDNRLTENALDDWHFGIRKNYAAFSKKYPLNGEMSEQGSKIKAMHNWCIEMDIEFTPTIFFDGFQLPPNYTIDDLKYFI